MYTIDYNKPVTVHFIGIGGISMSGLAEILLSKGFTISGSDIQKSDLTSLLESRGARIYIGQKAENITGDIAVIVFTAAVGPGNPEYDAAVNSGIPMLTRAQLLGQMMSNYNMAIGVSGTHGKTTTTSMLAEILLKAGLDPTVTVGGILSSIGGNLRVGASDNFLTEACEYTNSFLSFSPTIGVILNIQEDHLDFFKDLNDIRSSFNRYAKLLPASGLLVINSDIDNYREICEGVNAPVITVGSAPDSDYSACDIQNGEHGISYMLMKNNKPVARVNLGVFGLHNVYNSLAAIAVADSRSIDIEVTLSALSSFTGANRRFQLKGVKNGMTILDDYAHHPAEISATLKTAREAYPDKRIVCIFQPHTYTRTKAFLKEFADALSDADLVILADIYAAREKNTIGISSEDIKLLIDEKKSSCLYLGSLDSIRKYILENCGKPDLVITMGAGDVVKIGDEILA